MLDISEIFLSLQGEGWRQGIPAIFIRFYGCNLQCRFCDTPIAFIKKRSMDEESILKKVKTISAGRIKNIIITGGEPYLQNFTALVRNLKQNGFSIAVETNGTIWRKIPIDWICVSPKKEAKEISPTGYDNRFKKIANEFRYIITKKQDFAFIDKTITRPVILQPINNDIKIALIISDEIKKHGMPNWFLRFQMHKLMGIL
ncbi:MAG TPA: 7-carboxy-7-deazaguanine synthase QueE [bacterium]|nr:7-carboxy-7-deazaguanine synthase QueE [bacterium]